ncbi:MAG: CDP-diacylglycerol--glycerol-3-phosphate 3-phosphatidyltransferase [Myxococcota bacterium]
MGEVADIASARAGSKARPGRDGDGGDPIPFGEREAFWNWPNTITVFRMAMVPVMLFLPFAQSKLACQIFAWCFIVAAVSDIIDGWLARRGAQVTRIGKLLDPLADKLLVSTALIMLIVAGRLDWWGAWMVVVIVGRELAVTGLRGIASSQGHIVAASWTGKLKAATQNVAIGALLFHYETLGLPAHEIGLTLLALATALTLWSGYLYFADYFGWPGRSAPDPRSA